MKKIAVIGAGIVGVCIAHFLRKSGNEVELYDQFEPGSQTSFGNAGLFANHECVTVNSPQLWKDLPSMLLSNNSPLVVDWIYIIKHLPWALSFLRNCTHEKVEHIANSLSDFSSHAEIGYEEICTRRSAARRSRRRGTPAPKPRGPARPAGTGAGQDACCPRPPARSFAAGREWQATVKAMQSVWKWQSASS